MTGHEIAVITGASAGVGRATAREFAKHGAWIGLLARDETALEHAKREVEGSSDMTIERSKGWCRCVGILDLPVTGTTITCASRRSVCQRTYSEVCSL